MKKFFVVLFCVLGSAMLIVALLIMSVELFALNQGFFSSEYQKLGTASSIGMTQDTLDTVTKNLLDYTNGSRDSLDMTAEINGTQREVFDDREKAHMVDVRALNLHAKDVMYICFICAAALFILAFILRGKNTFKPLCRSFTRVSAVAVVVIGAIAIYAAVDFYGFWTNFHHVFFTNDLWLLDPNTEVLINMVPEQFFSDLVMSIIATFVSAFLALNIVALIGSHIIKKRSSNIKEA